MPREISAMRQGDLFTAHVPTLGLLCSFGQRTEPGSIYAADWAGPHHCRGCAAHVEALCAAFDREAQR